jgi:hypothetical protein
MAMYCGWARIIGIEVSTCRDYDRADATELCGTILTMSEEEEMENRRCDTSVPATNPSPIVLEQIGLQKPHERRPSPVVLNRGIRRAVVSYGWLSDV